jgi:hypothetical protein
MLVVQMPLAQEVDQIAPGIFIWQIYDKTVRADLFSTGLETTTGTWLIDPVPLEARMMNGLERARKIAGIFITNVNHPRCVRAFATMFAVPVFVHAELKGGDHFEDATGLQDGEQFSDRLTAIAIDGGPAGEMALHYDSGTGGGTLVIGDALINFEPHGFGLLPAKYCLDAKLMRRSLGKLLDYSFDRILFAHGTPILSGARARLEQLLGETG